MAGRDRTLRQPGPAFAQGLGMQTGLIAFLVLGLLWFIGYTLAQPAGNALSFRPFRILLLVLSAAFVLYATRFELHQEWPGLTLRPPSFHLLFPASE